MNKVDKEKCVSKAMVTGASGFIGSMLVERLLRDGYIVIGIDSLTDFYSIDLKRRNLANALGNENFIFIEKDILELEKLQENIKYIFHTAAQPGVRSSWGKSFNVYVKDNVLVTQHLLELCKERKGLKKIVYSSSSSIYGDAEAFPTNEEVIPRPISPYGVTKLAAEHLFELYHRNYGINVVALRYFTVFGPRQRPDMAFHKFIKSIIKRVPIVVYGDGKQTRDFTFIDDIIEANVIAMKSKSKYRIFNIGGGNHVSINDVIEVLKDLMGRNTEVRYQKKEIGDVKDTMADTSRAETELGFHPKYDLHLGLKKEIEWLQAIYCNS